MNNIQIGKIIAANRKLKGVTQEELAKHLNVSKPAVSKWESGQSYPDIILLPVIAAFFNISVDQLIGYEPQMIKEDIRKLYHRLADNFAKHAFEKVYAECEEYAKKYFSCWYLQFEIALLYLNHSSLAGTPERTIEVIERALNIFEHVEKSCEEVNLAKQSLQLKAYCYLCLQQPVDAIDILEDIREPQIQAESLLVKAYQMKGDKEKAIETLQGVTFVNLSNLLSAAPDFFVMYSDQPEKLDSFYHIFLQICEAFKIEQLQPAKLYSIYLTAAAVYVMQERYNEAIDILERYVNLTKQADHSTFRLHGSDIFDALENYLDAVDIETAAPRNSEVIWKDIKNLIINNPAFAPLENEVRFKHLKRRLEE